MPVETKTTQQKIIKLSASNSDTAKYLSDQLLAKFGTTRKSEIIAKIGDTGVSYEKLLTEYIDAL